MAEKKVRRKQVVLHKASLLVVGKRQFLSFEGSEFKTVESSENVSKNPENSTAGSSAHTGTCLFCQCDQHGQRGFCGIISNIFIL